MLSLTKINYQIEYSEEPKSKDIEVLSKGINDDAFDKMQMDPVKAFGIFIKDLAGVNYGGVTGFSYFGCLHTDTLWISMALRGQGFGKKLMMKVEEIGRERKCRFATVNTMDFQALNFYQKLGYEIEFVREDYEKQAKMFMLKKSLL